MMQRLMRPVIRAALVIALLTTAFLPDLTQAQVTPSFRSSSTMNGSGTLSFPAGSVAGDLLVMYVISNVNPISTPAGWTLARQYGWTSYGFYSHVFTRQKGTDTSVTVSPFQGGAMILAYQNSRGVGTVGTYAENTGTTLTMNAITPQNAGSLILGLTSDRDPIDPTEATGFTPRLNFTTTYFGHNYADKAYGSTASTGSPVWTQSSSYAGVGMLMEILPGYLSPTITAGFSPSSINLGGVSTLAFTLANGNGAAMTNAQFSDTLTNMSVASPTIGGTCAGTTNTPALTTGSTALNFTIPTLPSSGCTVTVQVRSTVAGTQSTSASGVTTTEAPTAGTGSNTANLSVSSTPVPATITSSFNSAWIASGANSTLVYTLGNPSNSTLTNAHFSSALSGMTAASTTIGGTCASVTNSPALTVGATSLSLSIPSVPGAGCTIEITVTSTTLGSNANVASAVTVTETSETGTGSNTAYLTVNPVDVGFYYVHADHLGTPRAITRPSDNQMVWKWENLDPFGNNQPNEDPNSTGIPMKYNLRFAGQFYDVETGTHYNYFRAYDPVTGRYLESDPIGLKGGINTYTYVGSKPVSNTDRFGLISPVPPEKQRYRMCTNSELKDCEATCGSKGLRSCRVSQTWRFVRIKVSEGPGPNLSVYGWVDGPKNCDCNECEEDSPLEKLLKYLIRPKSTESTDPLGTPMGPLPIPAPIPIPIP